MEALSSDKYQTVKGDTHMNRTLMFIALIIGFAVLAGLSVTSKAAESAGNVVDDTVITTTVKAELAKDIRLGTLTGIEVGRPHKAWLPSPARCGTVKRKQSPSRKPGA